MLVRAPIGVPGWGEARVEGRVDPRGGREGWRQEASRAFACTAISGGGGGGGGACPGPGAGAGGGGVVGGRAGGGHGRGYLYAGCLVARSLTTPR